ncbi:hypothetical protein KR018_005715 [Drosophila ironensis]|nr:hypothetical protein KR018_005715 [Drosophila ironensis]
MSVRRSSENIAATPLKSQVLCTICNDTNPNDSITETPCKHKFHRTCLLEWLTTSASCPNCRQSCSRALMIERQCISSERRMPSNIQTEQDSNPNPSGAIPKSRMSTRSQDSNNPLSSNQRTRAGSANPRR